MNRVACEEFAVSLPEIESYLGHKIPSSSIAPEILATELLKGEPSEDQVWRQLGAHHDHC